MGFSPREVGESSLWEMTAAIDGYRKANGTEPEAKPPTADEFFEQVARLS